MVTHKQQFLRKGEIKNIEYWDVQYEQESEDKGEEYYVEELRQLMKESIRRHHRFLLAAFPNDIKHYASFPINLLLL